MTALIYHPYIEEIKHLVNGKSRQVFLVGGAVRDAWLGLRPSDFDFAVRHDAVGLARRFARSVKGAFVLLDADHGCARVVKKLDGQTVTFDFADFRGRTLKQDLLGRDFTMNTIAVDVARVKPEGAWREHVQDPLQGRQDLDDRRLRMTGERAFQEDPLRLLRAYALTSGLGLKLDPATRRQIRQDHERIREVSAERVRDELFKICGARRAAPALRAMHSCGLLEAVIPQVTLMYGVEQGGYHHLDVWRHSLEAVAQLDRVVKEFSADPRVAAYLRAPVSRPHTRRALLTLGTLLHDVGKPRTRRVGQERMTFHGHEHAGRDIVRQVARQLKCSTRERRVLEDLVLWHLRPGYLSNFKHPTKRAYFRYFRDTGDEAVSIALLSLADQRATRGPMTTAADQQHHEHICRELVRRHFAQAEETPRPRLLTGRDVMTALKIKPSPLVGEILAAVEEQAAGKIKDRDEALALAARLVKTKG